ncbi:hypothetical protein CN326_13895 [Bacillus sp. AFS018417]|uniref:hypothetical protein n=1 Tax=Bacillus sp. AFS018417 TaxID=2033491 RepID=UPI000BF98C02|nr:hypothetical protein [Bacillus sp. AFS018417]PEZ05552.1 hypothetical protein CN326_13895 [Bacillus sp. AFS018417]
MENKKWENRDWVWLVGILITIIILLIAGFYNNDKIELNFTIISSAVSIALALVAIFIALKQDSDNQRVNDRISYLLNEISVNVRNVDAKVDKIDPRLLHSVTEEVVDEYTQESKEKETFTKEEVDEIVNKISKDITSNINDLINLENNKRKYSSSYQNRMTKSTAIKELKVKNIILDNMDKSLVELQDILAEQVGTSYSTRYIADLREEALNSKSKTVLI